jgi:hypothetical protein
MPKDVSTRSQLKTAIESSLAHLVSKCSIRVLEMDRFLLGLKGNNGLIFFSFSPIGKSQLASQK